MKKNVMSPHYNQSNILVTSPLLPPLEEFIPYLESIWESKRLTNGGPFHVQLENELSSYLGVKHISLFANGTLALMTALQALRITGEVITTPYSFVATSHALLWNDIKPVFVDIDASTCNLDPRKIEAAITPATTAIMPVHCYGIPCNMQEIQEIADNYGLKVIYDAAHAFSVKQYGESILNHGDLSVLSFHATKVFNTFEGGAIICPNENVKRRIDFLKNFGFADETTVVAPGINGKMNEIQAAFGVLQLKHVDGAFERRKTIYENYQRELSGIKGLRFGVIPEGVEWNYSYCPIFIDETLFPMTRDALYEDLKSASVYARRYFYPLISEFPMYKGYDSSRPENLLQALTVSRQVMCLPIYPSLTDSQQHDIIQALLIASHAKVA
ncbi:DegT/DnrJ/EryC1/StrS family aminotransferase [Pantoea sp. B9002]|uniref:DegT/DnrJ/EryC1/StrS family aminotransferase n=1 Tax=Pantoea sp. B9002 TaxID=2726979 RepID=UPI0015A49169|nr:DegT/DnrJ/EryC1/StrS family aminotransferase [Pantoea sp. B9002]NWA59875.1 DegT/DnrJ/EryC1/StrS family aminotransferase [Pantoea sp. B9002]